MNYRDTHRGRHLDAGDIEVLDLASRGRTNAQIAYRVGLSEDGVKTRMRRVLAKLDATDRAHAVRVGFQYGYLHLDAPVRRVAS